MGEKITLNIQPRQIHGKKVSKLRREGLVPGVVYGAGVKAYNIQAAAGEVDKVVAAAGKHTPVQLAGKKRQIAMIKSVDIHPVKRTIRHVAFHAVRADEPVIAEVPIRLSGTGESEAERAGLIVLQALEKIKVKALPMDLPEALEAPTSGLVREGDRVTVGDIVLPDGVELVENDDGREGTADDDITVKDLVVANVYEPSALAAANDAAAGEAESADAEQVEVTGETEKTEKTEASE